ncbi:MAG: polyribonucleotide nucleotidyltransferase [Campylobacterota bacterium]|nr:polyribonucleotide nucleotidyltransferase [Campylobacterota bacterium]
MQPIKIEGKIEGKKITFETGWWAKQADGAVRVTIGETIVLATVVSSKEEPLDVDFMPLTVSYVEKFYAAGRIPGGFLKREGRPTDTDTLNSRLIDRALRPLFPKDYKQDTQVIVIVISADGENDPGVLGICAASCALSISNIPFASPIAGLRVGLKEDKFIILPTATELKESGLNLIVAGSENAVAMIEAGAGELSEEQIVNGIFFGQERINKIILMQKELIDKAGKEKRTYTPVQASEELKEEIKHYTEKIAAAINIKTKIERSDALHEVQKGVMEELGDSYEHLLIKTVFEDAVREIARKQILENGIRVDGRGLDDIRPITCEIGVLPRTHGSCLFTRGETQALVTTTLGASGESQMLDTLSGLEHERFMLHYNFPPFCVGETGRLGPPGRREIGHGALAHRAIKAVMPQESLFPYVVRVVSEILESNGSSSMATVCGTTLALMDAGVPISKPVSGIAMGLVKKEEKNCILTDITGAEDHYGDMDFKVAGTKDGITALQMDIKIKGVNKEILTEALEKAKKARIKVLDKMLVALPEARKSLSPHAPQIEIINISPDKIKDVIGPGGKMIKRITEQTGAKINITQDGEVTIFCEKANDMTEAVKMVKDLAQKVEQGEIYEGIVSRVEDYGAFVKISPNIEGLVHISQLDRNRVNKVSDIARVGDKLKVKVLSVDEHGRVSLSRKALL